MQPPPNCWLSYAAEICEFLLTASNIDGALDDFIGHFSIPKSIEPNNNSNAYCP
ncbi:hypothetical protein [Citrobacter pasteurii]|nr:hypothetical protein [Citrobacter pasteurii]